MKGEGRAMWVGCHTLPLIKFVQQIMSQQRILSKYQRISIIKRTRLIQLVEDKGYSIARGARLLNLKSSTAKLIVKRYRTEGTFYEPKKGVKRPRQRQQIPVEAQILMEQSNESIENSVPPPNYQAQQPYSNENPLTNYIFLPIYEQMAYPYNVQMTFEGEMLYYYIV